MLQAADIGLNTLLWINQHGLERGSTHSAFLPAFQIMGEVHILRKHHTTKAFETPENARAANSCKTQPNREHKRHIDCQVLNPQSVLTSVIYLALGSWQNTFVTNPLLCIFMHERLKFCRTSVAQLALHQIPASLDRYQQTLAAASHARAQPPVSGFPSSASRHFKMKIDFFFF